MRYRVLVADPPWKFSDQLPGSGRGAGKHYACMTLNELKSFPIPLLAPDAYLFLWRVSSMVEEAYELVRAWGFIPKTELVWGKLTKTGKKHFGMGHHTRASHETCIIAVQGRPKPLVRNIRDTFDAKIGRHSEKPEEFYKLVETFASGPYVELFSRKKRPHWKCYGNEISTTKTGDDHE